MSVALTTIATTVTTTTIELTAADAFGGFVALIVGIVSFLSISGLALSMTIGASKSSPGTAIITAVSALMSVLIAVGLYMVLSTNHTVKLENCPAATWDKLGGTLAFIVGIVAFLSILGVLVTSAIGAFSTSKSPVTSWPQEQEQTFWSFDRRIAAAQSQAWVFSVIAGVLVFVFAFGIYQGVEPDKRDLAKDMNMSNITKKSKVEPAPATKQDAPKPEAAPKQ
jgi:hypothetical protein